ncbi:hypothetical protein SAY86_003408 [Trapa natans]|uniref:Uncharacterized protein n=1 Tax=Trapa natans TaxID=22666 RepID=A0AAN7MH31_TRANT|nr:hypothetical protein SAY86_003408 [Trapa natans]
MRATHNNNLSLNPVGKARTLQEEEEGEASKGGQAEAPYLVGAALQVALSLSAGVREGGIGRIDRVGPETDKQLVHKSEETALETLGGHAVYGDEWSTFPECSSFTLGRPLP